MKTETIQMAIESKTDMKAKVSDNKLIAQLLTNMIDSMLDLSGTLAFEDDTIVMSANGEERIRWDEAGNIYHDGADAIDDLDPEYKHEIYLGGKIIITHKTERNMKPL